MDASEKLIADTLSRHAADAPADDHLLSVVHARLRRRRTGRSIGAVVVAAAVVATAVTASQNLSTELHTDPPAALDPAPGWHWESFKTVQVQVPSSWTQYVSGSAPCPSSLGSPVIGRFNDWLGGRRLPCAAAVLPLSERQDYLWFNDVQAPGIKRYDGGWTEETRLVGGVKLSVLTRDDALRERILDSARPITGTDFYGCTPRDPGDQPGKLGEDAVTSVNVCEYYKHSLVAGSAMTADQVTTFTSQLRRVGPGLQIPATSCVNPAALRTFVITVHTRTTSWPLRLFVCGTSSAYDLFRQGPHRQAQPSDLAIPPSGVTPSPR
ncbi:hypothetical protein [Kribbella speibonae]|uniref:Uncharacterized protein n=1 Tax=Kribbella speibonae TaxID=1572660 RepID=A0A4R0I907_9ACTN|nr:hypothetical protein [Kribbella speibonae]TCC29451.1 hypothetical protein E0H92_41195 [Kribbella speibonae]